jgi:hypothetical protein
MTLFQHNNNTFININNISSNDINGSNTIDYFYLHFLDNEESIINLVLNKTIDSIVSYNYLIITSSNISKTIVESLLYQIFYMNQSDYISLIELISKNYEKYEKLDKKQEKVSINLYIDNTNELIPYKYIYYSKYIPLIIILLLLIFNRFFFKRNVYYNLCFNSSILRVIFSIIYVFLLKEKLKYNKIRYEYMPIISVDALIDSLNNFINDIYFSFIISSMTFIVYNHMNIVHFFNSDENIVKKYFLIFISLSIINIPNYLSDNPSILLTIKIYFYELFKINIFLSLLKEQIKHISHIINIYYSYHLVNGINILKYKKILLNLIKYFFILNFLFKIFLLIFLYIKYRHSTYYWDIILKCIFENNNSFIIFFLWIILYINEYDNQIFNLFLNKNTNRYNNYFKFDNNNEITIMNYAKIKNDINFKSINKCPIIILHPLIKRINNNNLDKINLGIIN